MRKSFILHLDSLEILDEMENDQAGILFKAIVSYQKTGDVPVLDFGMKMAFVPFKNQFERDNESYIKTVERNKINGKTGGRPRKKTQQNPNNPSGFSKTQDNPLEPKKPDNDNDNDSKNDNGNVIPLFIPPTLAELKAFFSENEYEEEAAVRAFYIYEKSGWVDKLGKPISDWKEKMARQWFTAKHKMKPTFKPPYHNRHPKAK